jgi:hypothetical protein
MCISAMNRTDPSREKNYLLLGTLILMPMGLDPATHAVPCRKRLSFGTRIGAPFPRPVRRTGVGGRVKPGHDG